MKSMTGYGRGVKEDTGYRIEIEIKSVNNRFLDSQFRLPKELNAFEADMRQLVKRYLNRGRVDVFINLTRLKKSGKTVAVHWELIEELVNELQQGAQTRFGIADLSLTELIQRLATEPDYVELVETRSDDPALKELIFAALTEALEQIATSREKEGRGIAKALQEQKQELTRLVTQLKNFVTLYQKDYQQRYEAKLKAYLSDSVDEARLLTELAILLERGDIQEELDRLEIHLQKLQTLLEQTGPVGRELDFLIQEINREINTTGSKSSPIEIKDIVVQMKTSAEKLREQVQNIE